MAIQRYNLTFNKQMSSQPIIYNIGRKFNVVPIIEKANITEEAGWMQIAFSGDPDEIQRAVADLNTLGIFVTVPEVAALG